MGEALTGHGTSEPQPPDPSQIGSPESLNAYLLGVEERMQRLALIVEAMRQSLAAGGLLSEAQLLEKVTELDLSDGVVDGRNVAPVLQVCAAAVMLCGPPKRFLIPNLCH